MKTIKKYSFIIKNNELKFIKGGIEAVAATTKIVRVGNTIVDDLNGLIR